MSNLYPPIEDTLKFDERVQKIRLENLLDKEKQIEVKLKHYKKLKRRWNIFKKIFHFGKYPIAVLQYLGDAALLLFPGTQPIGFIGIAVTTTELVGSNVLEDALLNVKVNKYAKKCDLLQEYINKMYVFKIESIKDGVISEHEMQLFTQLLNEYESKLSSHTDSKNGENLEVQVGEIIKKYMSQKNVNPSGS